MHFHKVTAMLKEHRRPGPRYQRRGNRPRDTSRQNDLIGGSQRPPHTSSAQTADSTVGTALSPHPSQGSTLADRPKKPRVSRSRYPRSDTTNVERPDSVSAGDQPGSSRQASRRKGRSAKFSANLTEPSLASGIAGGVTKPSEKYSGAPKKDDLTSILIHALRTPPYPDCPICFSAIHPAQPSWSCSLSIPSFASEDLDKEDTLRENVNAQCCWTTFHLKCIKSWAAKSVKDIEEAWRARGETRKGEWRCPGCQLKREKVPHGYWYVCSLTTNLSPSFLCHAGVSAVLLKIPSRRVLQLHTPAAILAPVLASVNILAL
ncbi:hypothetical protein EW146_g8070 [Bondarzewia mesenterica]|uniref:RING-type domain-containing protein n=1 Tax=Bondarzewia mesenterica TaxID=1095465 RepID=A0A4S4LHU9_9AGAM|nr:hypothetical protein EW146_g8070 [Bondarzewia mesenterica]